MSRSIKDLDQTMQWNANLFVRVAEANGLDVLIYCTRRTMREQAKLYRRGRPLYQIRRKADELDKRWGRPDLAALLLEVGPQYGRTVTNAAPGQSLHNYGLAFDGVPLEYGEPQWQTTDPAWRAYGTVVRASGLVWGGDWEGFKDYPHAQRPAVDWRDLIRETA